MCLKLLFLKFLTYAYIMVILNTLSSHEKSANVLNTFTSEKTKKRQIIKKQNSLLLQIVSTKKGYCLQLPHTQKERKTNEEYKTINDLKRFG